MPETLESMDHLRRQFRCEAGRGLTWHGEDAGGVEQLEAVPSVRRLASLLGRLQSLRTHQPR